MVYISILNPVDSLTVSKVENEKFIYAGIAYIEGYEENILKLIRMIA